MGKCGMYSIFIERVQESAPLTIHCGEAARREERKEGAESAGSDYKQANI